MSQFDQEILENFLKSRQPANMLLIGRQARLLVQSWCSDNPQCDVTGFDDGTQFNAEDHPEQYDFCVLAGALAQYEKTELEQLIARLRDRQSRQLVVQLDPPATDEENRQREQPDIADRPVLQPNDLRALGLLRLAGSEHLFQFNLHDYKSQPDWLNPQYWANPDRWNKDRW